MKHGRKNAGFVLFGLLVLLLTALPIWAVDEAQLTASAEKVMEAWEKVLSQNVDLVSRASSGYWTVRRHKLIKGSMGYDIKKTDSIVSPYMLIVNFSSFFMDNTTSPNANGQYDYRLKRTFGFKTAEEALNNTKKIDFTPDATGKVGGDMDLKVYYAYQKGRWVLKSGNRLFGFNFIEHLTSKENGHYFKDLLAIRIE